MRILLVEDDPMIADAVKSALADEAHAVDHVSSGRTALTQLGLSDFERILAGHFTTEASSVRFGVDQDNLEQRNILRAPGRVVEGEALRLVLPGEPTNDSELPQA